MNNRLCAVAAAMLAGLAAPGNAGGAPSIPAADNNAARISDLENQIQTLSDQVADLKRSTSSQYADIQDQNANAVQVSLKNGRPSFKTADGAFSLALRALVQFDTAYYGQGKTPAGLDFSSGSNFRRARLGAEGVLFSDWSYEFIYDFGGSGTETTGISSAYLQYNGLGPVHIRAGVYPTPESFDDATAASDLPFLERAQPADLARGIAGSDGRDGISVFAYDDDTYAALSYTGGKAADAAVFDEQQALVGRFAWRVLRGADYNLALGADGTYVFKLADASAGAGSTHSFRLRERPELNADSQNVYLVDTGSIDAGKVWEWGFEAAGNWRNFYAQGGYFGFDAVRRASTLPDPSFGGWYLQTSWVLTGEAKPYRPERGAFGLPAPADPFSADHAGLGAWEIAARYSELDLNFRPGLAGAAPAGGIRGGVQKIWTAGLNWYPNGAIRVVLDYQHTEVGRLNNAGAGLGATLDAASLRLQLSL
jgi:phosphate-selective porin OprO and OprP